MSILYGDDGHIINVFSIKNLANSISYFAKLGFVKGQTIYSNKREGSDTE
jgi:hypothetical protein